ncbi:MAG: DUF1636 domain-containing protein [Hyphomicrobiales bacterium]|nr:DUF1636 family protein [Hyphomicrobiales bacterium]MDE2016126.1 DUF1636 domain-containing protein [Hyphomicrobiales bacterium]
MRIDVCVSCRAAGDPAEPREGRPGARLAAALESVATDGIEIARVDCLSVCKRPCTIAFSARGKWTYVYGDFGPDAAADVLVCARTYADATEGIIPWKERPEALKRGVVARIPPFTRKEAAQ